MAVRLPTININAFDRVIELSTESIEDAANDIINGIRTNANPVLASIPIDPNILENHNIRYAEKQVRGIDRNFGEYNTGYRIRSIIPMISSAAVGRDYLLEKSFSGDVSGEIGESIFVHFLTNHLTINPDNIGHLRPEKRRRYFTPDFIIWQNDTTIAGLLEDSSYELPLLAEVKSSTGTMSKDRIQDGLNQLLGLVRRHLPGLLFLLYRGRNNAYEACIAGVEY